MALQINKLISIIDDLLIWIRENPDSLIPKNEKDRLHIIIKHLDSNDTIPKEEWEKTKNAKQKITNLNLNENPLSEKFQRLNNKYQKLENRKKIKDLKKKAGIIRNQITIHTNSSKVKTSNNNESKLIICPNCNSKVLERNIMSHQKKCSKNINHSKPKTLPIIDHQINKRKGNVNEKKLDSSFGYHAFKRENGRFGSHSMYDNMDDNSHP